MSREGGFAHIAQSVEHFLGKEEVTGSNPVMSSTIVPAGVAGVFAAVALVMGSVRVGFVWVVSLGS